MSGTEPTEPEVQAEPEPEPEAEAGAEARAESAAEPEPEADLRTREMVEAIKKLQRLELTAESSRGRNLWVQVSRVGTLGWLLALPIVGGALLGHLLDRTLDTGLAFTLAFLILGVAVAGFTLWRHTVELDDRSSP